MAGNTFGTAFRVTTFGESHGVGLGCVIDGCPAGLKIDVREIQNELDRRRPGQSKVTTGRSEADCVEILSGIFEGRTLGTPISIRIPNRDFKIDILPRVTRPRPGHADLSGVLKYNRSDVRDILERASARDTVSRTAVGSFAKGELGTISSDIAGIQAGQTAQTTTLGNAITGQTTTLQSSITGQTTTLQGSITGQTTTLQGSIASQTTTLGNQIGSVGANVTALPTTVSSAVTTAVSSDMATQMAKGVQAELLTRPADVATGATIPIRFRTASGLSPKITVYDPNGTPRVSAEAMKEISTTGIYEYKLTLNTAWGLGDFTVLVTESTKGSTDSLILHVGLGGLDEIYSSISALDTGSTGSVSLDNIYAGVTTVQAKGTVHVYVTFPKEALEVIRVRVHARVCMTGHFGNEFESRAKLFVCLVAIHDFAYENTLCLVGFHVKIAEKEHFLLFGRFAHFVAFLV